MTVMTVDAAPLVGRRPLRFGATSVLQEGSADPHWQFGGVTAESDACVKLGISAVTCDAGQIATGFDKDASNAYGTIDSGPALFGYLLNKCRTVGRLADAQERTERAYLSAENAVIDMVVDEALNVARAMSGDDSEIILPQDGACLAAAIGAMEAFAATEYGMQPIIWLPRNVAPLAFVDNLLIRVDDHLETQTGSLVGLLQSTTTWNPEPEETMYLYVSGQGRYYSGDLFVQQTIDLANNEFYVLAERAYAAIFECGVTRVTVPYRCCSCGAPGAPI